MSRQTIVLLLLANALLFATRCAANLHLPINAPMPTAAPSATSAPAPTSATGASPTILATRTRAPTATPLATTDFGSAERDITYCAINGVALKLDLYYPKQSNGKPLPVAVNVHGGSWRAGDKARSDSAPDIPDLLERGYLVAAVNYRLAPSYKFPAQIEDIKCAVRFLRANAARYHLDPDRIGAWGCSAGGHLVALLGVTDPQAGFDGAGGFADQSSRVRAVAALSAPTDLTLYDAVARANMLEQVFGVRTPNSPMLARASPITYISKDAAPFLIVQGDKDEVVSIKHAEKLYERLTAVGVSAELTTVENGRHCFPSESAMRPSRAEISRIIADFFDQKLR
jgi:acetyl esterase/lipase